MKRSWLLVSVVALALGACTGLQQFPETSKDYTGDLGKLDPAYQTAITAIKNASADPPEQKRLRNVEIDTRLRVIDLNFDKFLIALAQESVGSDFGFALVQVGLGGAGALMTGAASQILSAVSGGLAGAQEAYSKAALYEKTVSALIAQMIASRKAVRVIILEGRAQDVDVYSLSAAAGDILDYKFAGSLPGAVKATAADAQAKEAKADVALKDFREITIVTASQKMFDRREALMKTIDGLDTAAKAKALVTKIAAEFPAGGKPFIDAQYPESKRILDRTGDVAKKLLKRVVTLTVRNPEDAAKWQAAIDSL